MGHIRYSVKINIDIKWGFDDKFVECFYVAPKFNLNEHRYLQAAQDDQEDKTFGCCCWQSEPLKLVTKLPRQGYVPGESIKFQVEVNNESDVDIDSMEVKLKEKITYFTHTPSQKSRTTDRELWRNDWIQDRAVVHKLQKKMFDVEIFLNPTLEFKVFNNCSIIVAEYFLKVNAIPGGCHSRLSNITGITIGTIPFDEFPLPNDFVPLAPYGPVPSAPADLASAPPGGIVFEQPLPNYHDAVYNPQKPSITNKDNNAIGWAIPGAPGADLRKCLTLDSPS